MDEHDDALDESDDAEDAAPDRMSLEEAAAMPDTPSPRPGKVPFRRKPAWDAEALPQHLPLSPLHQSPPLQLSQQLPQLQPSLGPQHANLQLRLSQGTAGEIRQAPHPAFASPPAGRSGLGMPPSEKPAALQQSSGSAEPGPGSTLPEAAHRKRHVNFALSMQPLQHLGNQQPAHDPQQPACNPQQSAYDPPQPSSHPQKLEVVSRWRKPVTTLRQVRPVNRPPDQIQRLVPPEPPPGPLRLRMVDVTSGQELAMSEALLALAEGSLQCAITGKLHFPVVSPQPMVIMQDLLNFF